MVLPVAGFALLATSAIAAYRSQDDASTTSAAAYRDSSSSTALLQQSSGGTSRSAPRTAAPLTSAQEAAGTKQAATSAAAARARKAAAAAVAAREAKKKAAQAAAAARKAAQQAEKKKADQATTQAATGSGAAVSTSAPCASGSSVETGLKPDTIAVHRAVCAAFPQITSYGGLGPREDHSTGNALDIMVSGPSGWTIAKWLQANHAKLGISYLIYSQHIWSVQRSSEGWRAMEDRGSTTANHYDHVHVTTYGNAALG